MNEDQTHAELKKCYKIYDKNNNLSVSPIELFKIQNALGVKVTEEDTHQILKELDTEGDGCINYNNFVKFYKLPTEKCVVIKNGIDNIKPRERKNERL